jgi:hypothetical protein
MDPLERALRLGEDREAAKEREDPRCVAGVSRGRGLVQHW